MKFKISIIFIALTVILFAACSSKLPNELYEKAKADAAQNSSIKSRDLSFAEQINWLKFQEEFIYNDKKPKAEMLPAKLELPNADNVNRPYYIYPQDNMTDNQLLQLSQLVYGDKINDLTPKTNELQYSEVKALVPQLLDTYGFEYDEIENIYVIYQRANDIFDYGMWYTFVSCKTGYDYQLRINAETRLPYSIFRCAQNEYSLHKELKPIPDAKDYTDEQLLKKAEKYYNGFGLLPAKGQVDLAAINIGSPSNGYANYKTVTFKSDKSYVQMNIDMSNLSICGITVDYL